jgi:hypothetical protein
MADDTEPPDDGLLEIGPDVAQLPRVTNAISGGDANFVADREVVDSLVAATPNGLAGLQAVVEALHRFVRRAVRVVGAESDTRQFLHIGMAPSSKGMADDEISVLVPGARTVYVSYDTTTLAHAHELKRGLPDGSVAHVHCRFDDTEQILAGAAATLDLAAPVAVVLPTSLNLVTDAGADRLLDALRTALAPGSHLVLAETSLDIVVHGTARVAQLVDLMNTLLDVRYEARPRDVVATHLDGFDLLEPGLVPIEQWRGEGDDPFLPGGELVPLYGAVGRLPGA